uniref:Efflux transporter, outer membrane factor (OMF) lipoprotein, NodT family n=1 Tax=Candidatus Kentrum sp. MB TaxID=2138164 RepID=A0A450XCZ9_9GAMM|nr:MAG: efflux transporter, outer membrane factor (OMF) lipoprotein, NodT family [Candidatus Kentron sp. MB]VFK27129.1 MAG: efflux transporter, outer membrane factor (OMF) lipoprotein, NodT family [Candidatus Kentron sp. MB]VFK74896.1 MAG: efflux transporter, outer membrane factor (OMF) lipoprotein, NodT family [Candidatus Kentron sp. MB]
MRFHRYLFVLFYLGTLAGCADPIRISGPSLKITVPEHWTAIHSPSPSPATKVNRDAPANTSADPIPSWVADFDAPALHTLVTKAIGKNFDLQAVQSRVQVARARARVEGAGEMPQFTVGLLTSRRKNGTTGTISNHLEFNMDMNWELDLWKRLDNSTKAAVAKASAQEAEYCMARLRLAADVANAWFDAIESEQQLILTEKTIASFQNSLDSIEQGYRLGIGSALDVRLARENLATARSQREIRARNRDTALRSLEILLGRYPAATRNLLHELPELRRAVPVGLPSELLNRRPDIIAAHARLLATDHNLAAARANRLPVIRLTASGGAASRELRDLISPDSLAWDLISALTQPLWDGGRRSAQTKIAAAQRQQAEAEYTVVALRAFREVESALMSEALLSRQEIALETATQEAKAASLLARDRYRQGLSDIMTLLSTQRRQFQAESSLLSIRKQRLSTRVSLYLALGGEF